MNFALKDDWFDYRLEHDPSFLYRIDRARASITAGFNVKLEDMADTLERTETPHLAPQQSGATDTPPASPSPSLLAKPRRRTSRAVQ